VTPLVFVHVPKAAGSTFTAILRHHYPGAAFDGGINVFQRFEQAIPRLETAATRPDLRAISAEVTFGLADRYLPDARYVTILREPVERTLSQFWFFRAGRGAGLISPQLGPPQPNLTVAEALEAGYLLDNLQTRLVCGIVSPSDPLPADALERAQQTLAQRFFRVGTTERFDAFLALVNVELGWPTVPYRRTQVNPDNRGRETLGADDLRLVEDANTLDRQLYGFARQLLEDALAAARDEVETELEILRRAQPLQRRGRKGEAPDAATIRALPVDARVALALKEAELGRTREQLSRKLHAVNRLKRKLGRRKRKIAELKDGLDGP
jgi:hypothetical protein